MEIATYPLTFLRERALNHTRPFSSAEQTTRQQIRQALQEADELVVCLGGKAGRLGECVVGTGLLSALFAALHFLGKTGTPVRLRVDTGAASLFAQPLYQHTYWPQITIEASTQVQDLRAALAETTGQRVLILDCHGANDGDPFLRVEMLPGSRQLATLGQLFRAGVRDYAARGVERRYADWVEELFSLPPGCIRAQPRLLLASEDHARYRELAAQLGLDEQAQAVLIVCFFQSVVPAKCYELWDEVLTLLSAHFAEHAPAQRLLFLLPCGPDADLPEGMRRADMEEWFQDFNATTTNARMIITSTASLRDLAILTSQAALALSNDTGPGHIAGALGIPTVVPFLPGTIYSRQVWSSTPAHHGVTLEPNPFSYREVEAAVIWGRTHIINRIPPEALQQAALACLNHQFE